MYRLHDNLSSGNAYKVRLLLTQLGIPFERIEYDIDRQDKFFADARGVEVEEYIFRLD